MEILMGIVMNLNIALGRMAISVILILPLHKHRRLLSFSILFIFFLQYFKVSLYKSFFNFLEFFLGCCEWNCFYDLGLDTLVIVM